jgi:hypothetical protein
MVIMQQPYIEMMLERFNMTDCHPKNTPAAPGTKLKKNLGPVDEDTAQYPYRAAVGTLLWLARCSRPDMLYACNQCAAHCSNPDQTHVSAVKAPDGLREGHHG